MKQFLRHIFLLVAMLVATANAWAQLPYNTVMTQSHFNDGNTTIKKQGTTSWSNGVRLGDATWGGLNYDDKYVDIALNTSGIPGVFSATTSGGSTGIDYRLFVSSNNSNYVEIWKSERNNNTINQELPKDTKYIRLFYSGNFAGNFTNIKVTELKYLNSPSSMNLRVGQKILNSTPSTNTITIDWCNVPAISYSIEEGTHKDKFSVTKIENNSSVGKYGTATIHLSYIHDDFAGEDQPHTATLKLWSNGTTYDVTLTGVTDRYIADFNWNIANVNANSGEYHVGDYATITDAYTLKNKTTDNAIFLPVTFTIKTLSRSSIYQEDGDGNYDNDVLSIESGVLKAKNAGVAKITATFDGNDEYKPFTKELTLTVSKHTPVFSIASESVYYDRNYVNGKEYADFFVSTCSTHANHDNYDKYDDVVLTFSTSDTDAAVLRQGSAKNKLNLSVFNKESIKQISLNIKQEETSYWAEHEEQIVVNLANPNNHVPFEMNTKALRDALYYDHEKSYGKNTCSETGEISLNQDDIIVWTANPLYYTIRFSGIPHKLTFQYKHTATATPLGDTKKAFIVYESPDGVTWNELWTTNGQLNTTEYVKINPEILDRSTKYIKFFYDATYTGYYKDIAVSELNDFEAIDDLNDRTNDNDTLDFGVHAIKKNNYPQKSFALRYANAGYKVNLKVVKENGVEDKRFTVSPSTITSIGGEIYGEYTPITVTYNTSSAHQTSPGTKLVITDEKGNKEEIILVATTEKSKQNLQWTSEWSASTPLVVLNQTITNAATNGMTAELPVKYRSSNPEVFRVAADSLSFMALTAGTATITAYQVGNDEYAYAEISKPFKATEKIIQHISWEQDLTSLHVGDDNVALSAKVYILNSTTHEWEFSQERTNLLAYSSPNNAVVSIVDNKALKVNGAGELLIKATVPGTEVYEATDMEIPVRVRVPSLGCEDVLLPVVGYELSDKFEFNPYESIKEFVFEIDRTKGIPGKLMFYYYGLKAWGQLAGQIEVYQSLDEGQYWVPIENGIVTPTTNKAWSLLLPLSREATHLKFVRITDINLGYHMLQFVSIIPAQYIEAEPVDFGDITINSEVTKDFVVSYANIKDDELSLTEYSTSLTLPKDNIQDECGAWGMVTRQVNIKANTIGAFQDYIYVHDEIAQITCTIPVIANVIKATPTLTWNPETNVLDESSDWREGYTKNATSTIIQEIKYKMLDNPYAHFDEEGELIIDKLGGVITITAYQESTENFNYVEKSIEFTIPIPTFIGGGGDKYWNNPNNWNVGRLPKPQEPVNIQASAELHTHDTVASIAFTQKDSNPQGTLHILSTGGLTVGNGGVMNVANSSITIDNTPEGAGFLRVDPTTANKPAKVTINYITQAFNSGNPRDEIWQYMGAPGNDMDIVTDEDKTLIYHWSEQNGWEKQASEQLTPFAGYVFTQNKGTASNPQAEFNITATPIVENQTITLTCTSSGMRGSNLFVNSFLAPIDLATFDDKDFTDGVEQTFYLYNSGSWNQWQNQGGADNVMKHGVSPGQYYALSTKGAELMDPQYDQTTIPPMQGVYVVATKDRASIMLDYTKHVYAAEARNQAMRAPQRQDDNFKRVRLQVSGKNSGADRMYVIQHNECTSGYDNGYDAKNMPVESQVSIYTSEVEGQMEISVSDKIDSTYIGFRAGADSEYTLRITSVVGDYLYIKDLDNQTLISVYDGEEYTFSAEPNSVNDRRFLLLDQRSDDVSTDEPEVRVYVHDKMAHVLGAPIGSDMVIYTIGGVAITNYTIECTPSVVDLSSLPTGVYVLRINDKAFKCVCK